VRRTIGGIAGAVILLSWAFGCLAADYAFTLTVTPEKHVSLGGTVTHVFILTNTGTKDDAYTLELDVPTDWSTLPVPASLSVKSGENAVVFVSLLAPLHAEARAYEVILQAVSSADPTLREHAVGRIRMEELFDVELSWAVRPPRARPGARVEGSVEVRNAGNAPDRYRIEISSRPDWPARLDLDEVHLGVGETRIVGFSVEVPPQALTDVGYEFALTATSIGNPEIVRTLTISGRVSPSPPELVEDSLFPEWKVGLVFFLDHLGLPWLTLNGRGEIPYLGDLNARLGLGMEGIEEASARIMRENWGVFFGQSTIAGRFLSVSGYPLYIFKIPGSRTSRFLFTKEQKGVSVNWSSATWDVTFASGTNTSKGEAFQDLQVILDIDGSTVLNGLISQAGDQTGSGIAFGGGLDVQTLDSALTASYLNVSPKFPGQEERVEWTVAGEYGCDPLSVEAGFSFSKTAAGTPPGDFYIRRKEIRFGNTLSRSRTLSCTATGSSWKAWSDDPGVSTDERGLAFGWSLQGGEEEFLWRLLGRHEHFSDLATAVKTSSHRVEAGGRVRVGSIEAALDVAVGQVITQTGSSIQPEILASVRFPDDLVSLRLSLRKGEASVQIGLAGSPLPDVNLGWTTEVMICGGCTFSTTVSACFPDIFALCGPVKGQVTGRVFVDANGSGTWDPGEERVEDVLLSLDGVEAITDASGSFAFPPVTPGSYELSIAELPLGLVPSTEFPSRVGVAAGQRLDLWLPLASRGWIVGAVFNDENQNGNPELGEVGIAGVAITVTGRAFTQVLRTGQTGQFIVGVPPGHYRVELRVDTLPERFRLTGESWVELNVPERGRVSISFGAWQAPRPVVATFGPPTAAFTYTPNRPSVGDTVTLDASESSAINAEIVSYEWEIGLGDQIVTASGQRVTVRFEQQGAWMIHLTVTDSRGLKAVAERAVMVSP